MKDFEENDFYSYYFVLSFLIYTVCVNKFLIPDGAAWWMYAVCFVGAFPVSLGGTFIIGLLGIALKELFLLPKFLPWLYKEGNEKVPFKSVLLSICLFAILFYLGIVAF